MPDEVWALFASAGFTCWCPAPVTVRPASVGTRSGRFPLPAPATFVTADNPGGTAVTAEENSVRRAALAGFLAGGGLVWHPAVGGDPDGGHLEPGAVVLGLDPGAAARLGARFGQAAVYIWAPDALHLVACGSDRSDTLGYRATPGTRLLPACAMLGP